MTKDHRRVDAQMAQEILLDDPDFLREIVEKVLQQLLEAEMTEHIGAAPYERSATRSSHRNGYKPRALRTRVGTLNLLVPQDREGTFSTRLFSRYQRNEKALVLALMEMYVEGASHQRCLLSITPGTSSAWWATPGARSSPQTSGRSSPLPTENKPSPSPLRWPKNGARRATRRWPFHLEEHIEECLSCLAFPEPHRRRIRTTNGLDRLRARR